MIQDISTPLFYKSMPRCWSAKIDWHSRTIILDYSNYEVHQVRLMLDKNWETYEMLIDGRNKFHVPIEFMNGHEDYFYGLYLMTACQEPWRNWLEEVRTKKPHNAIVYDEYEDDYSKAFDETYITKVKNSLHEGNPHKI